MPLFDKVLLPHIMIYEAPGDWAGVYLNHRLVYEGHVSDAHEYVLDGLVTMEYGEEVLGGGSHCLGTMDEVDKYRAMM